MKIDIVHVDKDDPMYKVVVIDDFFDDFENIKKKSIEFFNKNKEINWKNAFPGYEALIFGILNSIELKCFDDELYETIKKKIFDVFNITGIIPKTLDDLRENEVIDFYCRVQSIINCESVKYGSKIESYCSPHIDSLPPMSNLNNSKMQILIYLTDSEEKFDGTNFYKRIYTPNLDTNYYNRTNYPFKEPLTTIAAKKNRCLIYMSNVPHQANIKYEKMTTFERFTLNLEYSQIFHDILKDNFNFANLH